MNLFTWIKSLLPSPSSTTGHVTSVEPWPDPPSVAPVPVVELPISCFVRGLVKSMTETPGEWKSHNTTVEHPWRDHLYTVHGYINRLTPDTDHIYVFRSYVNGHACIQHFDLSDHETTELEKGLRSVETHYRQIEWETQEKRRAVLRAPFEKLGCPEGES